jgi:hypothetical protein
MGHLERLLRTAPPRCAFTWPAEDRDMLHWHTCVLVPGHAGGHACECGAGTAQPDAA